MTDIKEARSDDRKAEVFRFRNGERDEVELVETTEIPVVRRMTRVVEEVHVSKTLVERTADVHATVRHTEIDVVPLTTEDGWTVA